MPAMGEQLVGWNEWANKLKVLVTDLPKVAAKRCTMAALGVIKKALLEKTKSASIPPRIRTVAVRSIGISTSKAKNESGQYGARVGYGIGKGFWKPSGRTSVSKEEISELFGKRDVYRRYASRTSRRSRSALAKALVNRLSFRGRSLKVRGSFKAKFARRTKGDISFLPTELKSLKVGLKVGIRARGRSKFLGMFGKQSAGRIARRLAGKRKVVTKKRLRGVGITKRNIHWAIWGTGVRTVKNWRGSGTSKQVGRFQPYLYGILSGVVSRNAQRAYEAANVQLGKILADAASRRLSKVA